MESFNEYILPFLEGDTIRYQHEGVAKSVSADYFRNNFRKVAATELPNIGQRTLYYQSTENPDLVFRFRVSEATGVSAMLVLYGEFEKQMKRLDNM